MASGLGYIRVTIDAAWDGLALSMVYLLVLAGLPAALGYSRDGIVCRLFRPLTPLGVRIRRDEQLLKYRRSSIGAGEGKR